MNDITLFQNFEVKGGPDYGRKNLPLLQAALKKQNLDGLYLKEQLINKNYSVLKLSPLEKKYSENI